MYDRVRTPHGTVDNVMKVHSLRPHTMEGHVALYRSVLHNPNNTLALWFLEVIACYTSMLNDCAYSLTHHFANVRRLLRIKPAPMQSMLRLRQIDRKPLLATKNSRFCIMRVSSRSMYAI